MTLSPFSPAYFLCLGVAAALVVGTYFLFRNAAYSIKWCFLMILMLINLGQHIGKSLVWPHLYGTGFGTENTAYNVCALIIYASPFILLFGRGAIRDAVVYIGTAGPLLSMIVPYWFQGQPLLQWEVLRFYTCHVLLIMTSLLPALWGVYRLSWRNFFRIPIFFFLMMAIILINYIILYARGMWGQGLSLFDALLAANPCWVMRPNPPEGYLWAQKAFEALSPKAFLGNAEGRPYLPLLWYAIPVYIGISFSAFLVGIAADRKRFVSDLRALRARRSKRAAET